MKMYSFEFNKLEVDAITEALDYTAKVNKIEINKYDKGLPTKIPNDEVRDKLKRWLYAMETLLEDFRREFKK